MKSVSDHQDEIALALNAGSSRVRIDAFVLNQPPQRVAQEVHRLRSVVDADFLQDFLRRRSLPLPAFVVHRVVHGGELLTEACAITPVVEKQIDALSRLAPLHNPSALELIRTARAAFGPITPQIAAFDTSFFSTLPEAATRYAIPRQLSDLHGIRRYGFHGFAHQSLRNSLSHEHQGDLPQRVVTVQLGSGCSMAAIQSGQAVNTTMGFSPLEGLVMATRCGDLDPGVLLYLLRAAGLALAQLEKMLNQDCGLFGLSELSGDMSELIASTHPNADQAIEIFCHSAVGHLGAMIASLQGVDAIVFGGGIGENCAQIRQAIAGVFEWAGVTLDAGKNRSISPARGGHIHAPSSKVQVWVFPVDEARILVHEGVNTLNARSPKNDSE